jgi:two-component system, NtrC family, C4-dicarboxylate transport response regulator DctD
MARVLHTALTMNRIATASRGNQLILADDDAATRSMVRSAIGASYDEVIEVEDGRALFWTLVQAWYELPPSATMNVVVITDILMPVYDGLDVLEAWQEFECNVPLLVTTGYADERIRARVAKLGVPLLTKPFSVRVLRESLARIAPRPVPGVA